MIRLDKERMRSLIDGFISHQTNQERAPVKKLLLDDFLNRWLRSEDCEVAMRESVSNMQAGKLTAIQRYHRFADYLSGNGVEVVIDWPTGDPSSRFERLVAICRLMQGKEAMRENQAVDSLCEKLWVSDRTIREDMRILRDGGREIYKHSALNQAFLIDGLTGGHHPVQFLSSVHPVLLLENLTTVLLLIESLLEKAQQMIFRSTCLETANHIWSQLTDYARAKVRENICRDFVGRAELLDIFDELEALQRTTDFRSEQYFMTNVSDKLLHYLKMNQCCKVIWEDEAHQVQEKTGIPRGYAPGQLNGIIFRDSNGAEFTIPESSILDVSRVHSS